MRVYVAGHRGLVGSAIVRAIEKRKDLSWVGKTRSELNLLEASDVEEFIGKEKPDAIILAAAKVGGIGANVTYPVDFLTENLQIELNVMKAAHELSIERLVFLGSSCIYPRDAEQPIPEKALLAGPLEKTNEAYALAKIAGVKLVESYRRQFGHRWISVMPTNLYGPGDNFDLENSHVIPALIRKFHEAKVKDDPAVHLWGSGDPLREFLHSEDLATAILLAMERYDSHETLNIGSGREISIMELAETIGKLVGFSGTIAWDTSKPNGTPRKILNSQKLRELGWRPRIDLETGLSDLIEEYSIRSGLKE